MEKIWNEMYEAANSVLNERRIQNMFPAEKFRQLFFQNQGKYIQEYALIPVRHSVYALRGMQYSI